MSDTLCTNCRGQSTGGCELCNPSLHIATTRKPDYETELPDITKQAVIDIQQDQIALLKTKIELLEIVTNTPYAAYLAQHKRAEALQAQLDAAKALERCPCTCGLCDDELDAILKGDVCES